MATVFSVEKPYSEPQRAAAVTRPHAGHQAEGGAVGDLQRLGLVVERDHRLHWPEDLFLRDAVAGVHVGHQRGRHVAALGRQAGRQRRLGGDVQAAVAHHRQIALDDLLLAAADDRAHVHEHAALHQDARRRRASLARVLDAGVHQEGQRGVEVGVVEHELRALAAEFQRHRHRVLGGRGLYQAAHVHRARERHVPHARVRRQRRAGFFAQARHHVQRAGRQAGLNGDAHEGQRGETGLFGRLQHAGVAHGQRRADAAADDLHRVVPGHDVRGHAVRFAQRQRGVAVDEGDGLAHHLVGRAAVKLQVARQRHRVGAALLQRLAHVQRLQPRQFIGLGQYGRAHLHQHAPALGGGERAPGAVQRRLRGLHGVVHVLRGATGDVRQHAAVRRVVQRQRLARAAGAPAPSDADSGGVEGNGGDHRCLLEGSVGVQRVGRAAAAWA